MRLARILRYGAPAYNFSSGGIDPTGVYTLAALLLGNAVTEHDHVKSVLRFPIGKIDYVDQSKPFFFSDQQPHCSRLYVESDLNIGSRTDRTGPAHVATAKVEAEKGRYMHAYTDRTGNYWELTDVPVHATRKFYCAAHIITC